ncbi:hypothetical protein [Wenyingzhuangia sp. IMCC45574]
MQPNSQQKQSIVQKITNSESFKNAPTSIALLQYLFDATSKNINLKEGVIDIEFFGSKENSEKNNPRVRVNVYNLRKKLTAYYEKEGKNNVWEVSIPKGQYAVVFTKRQSELQRIQNKISWPRLIPYMALVICISLYIYSHLPATAPKLWKPFLERENTNVFIGDLFGMNGVSVTGSPGWTRDYNINTETEFYNFLEKKPELKGSIKPSNFTYTTTMAALATRDFQKLFQSYNQEFSLRFTTKSSTSEIKETNAIYAGPLKEHNLFVPFFNEGNTICQIKDRKLHIKKPNTKEIIYNLNSYIQTDEFALVSKYPATGETQHIIFISQHDIGVSATVEYFTNPETLKEFTNTYLKNNEYFTAIFRVKGQDRTSIDLKLVAVFPF